MDLLGNCADYGSSGTDIIRAGGTRGDQMVSEAFSQRCYSDLENVSGWKEKRSRKRNSEAGKYAVISLCRTNSVASYRRKYWWRGNGSGFICSEETRKRTGE